MTNPPHKTATRGDEAVVATSEVIRPNKALQQTGHAIQGSSSHNAQRRVSRLLSWLFGSSCAQSVLLEPARTLTGGRNVQTPK
jgi:hypothetical protein